MNDNIIKRLLKGLFVSLMEYLSDLNDNAKSFYPSKTYVSSKFSVLNSKIDELSTFVGSTNFLNLKPKIVHTAYDEETNLTDIRIGLRDVLPELITRVVLTTSHGVYILNVANAYVVTNTQVNEHLGYIHMRVSNSFYSPVITDDEISILL